MATNLHLRNTTTSGIADTGDALVYDLIDTAGTSPDTAVVTATASGTDIQLTKTAGGSSIAWISGRVPAGGFTLTTSTFNGIWLESAMSVNATDRFRIYRYIPGTPTITELGGSPFSNTVEFGTSATLTTIVGNNTDQAFNEDDRILIRLYITNVGTMGAGTCTATFNGIILQQTMHF